MKSPWWAPLSVAFGAVLLAGSGIALIGGKVLLDQYSSTITHPGGLGSAAAPGKSIDGPINVLLVGIDQRAGDTALGARADSIIIAHVPASHDSVYLTSIPRDLRVQIPPFAKTGYAGGTDKVNAAFEFGFRNGGGRDGGLELLAETVGNLSGGLRFNMRPQVYAVGCRHFAAWEALDYVRQRDLLANHDADYGRQRHQQQFIKAMLTKATSAGVITNPVRISQILDSLGQAVSFYNNNVSLADWIFTLKAIKPSQMVMLKINSGQFHSETINGQSFETLDRNSKALLGAILADQVGAFVAAHPEMVNGTPPTSTPANTNDGKK